MSLKIMKKIGGWEVDRTGWALVLAVLNLCAPLLTVGVLAPNAAPTIARHANRVAICVRIETC